MSDLNPAMPFRLGKEVLAFAYAACCISFSYGLYCALLCLSTRCLWRRGLKSRSNLMLVLFTLIIYVLVTAQVILKISSLIQPRLKAMVSNPETSLSTKTDNINQESIRPASDSSTILFLVEANICDLIVIARAYAISQRSTKILVALTSLWLVSLGGSVTNIIATAINHEAAANTSFMHFSELAVMMASLAINLSVLGVSAKRLRLGRLLKGQRIWSRKVHKLLVVLVEAGLLYIVIWTAWIVLGFAVLNKNSIWSETYLQCLQGMTPITAGMYPSVIIIILDRAVWRLHETNGIEICQPSSLIFASTMPVDCNVPEGGSVSRDPCLDHVAQSVKSVETEESDREKQHDIQTRSCPV